MDSDKNLKLLLISHDRQTSMKRGKKNFFPNVKSVNYADS